MADQKPKDSDKFSQKITGARISSIRAPTLEQSFTVRGISPSSASIPGAPVSNPFNDLSFPSPGDRIKADDFKKLSQSLQVIYDTYALSGTLFGRNFGEVKLVLASQQYEIQRAMSVFGTEIDNLADAALDNRKVIQVVPAVLGEREVMVVLTEAVETRRFAPNLIGLTYQEASEKIRALLGDIPSAGVQLNAPQLIGLSLEEAQDSLNQ